jgi:hypothetical protein
VQAECNNQKVEMINTNQTEDYRRIHFAIMAIEASAKKERISGKAMHARLKAQDLIHQRLLHHYDLLHTQSLDWVVDDTVETYC